MNKAQINHLPVKSTLLPFISSSISTTLQFCSDYKKAINTGDVLPLRIEVADNRDTSIFYRTINRITNAPCLIQEAGLPRNILLAITTKAFSKIGSKCFEDSKKLLQVFNTMKRGNALKLFMTKTSTAFKICGLLNFCLMLVKVRDIPPRGKYWPACCYCLV